MSRRQRFVIREVWGRGINSVSRLVCVVLTALFSVTVTAAFAEEVRLQELIEQALRRNPEVLAFEARVSASQYRIPQAKSLPDPMIVFGYQNVGFGSYTLGQYPESQWMFSASQTFPFPGKLSLKGDMATREAEGQQALYREARQRTIERVKLLYYDLYLAYKGIDLLKEQTALFARVEDAAIARYSSGMGPQQEVLMVQAEKYMLLDREEMLRQKIQSLEAMLNTAVGRHVTAPLGRPMEPIPVMPYVRDLEDLLKMHVLHSPVIEAKEKMVAAAEAKVQMAKREYYPDFTLNAGYFKRRGEFDDIWSLTTAINIPIFYATKQKQAVREAEASLSETRYELEASKLMVSSSVRDNYSMIRTAERLAELYKTGLIPKTHQDFESALSGYVGGRTDALSVITRLKSLIDLELLYWGQVAEREKAIARLEAAAGLGVVDLK